MLMYHAGTELEDLMPNFPNNPNTEGDPYLPENEIWNILNPNYEKGSHKKSIN